MGVRLKGIAFGALLVAMALVVVVNTLGIDWYPPTWHVPGGQMRYVDPDDIRWCMGARFLSRA